MRATVLALIIRNIQKRFILSVNTKRGVGFLWLFIEPMLHIALWGGVRLFYNVSSTGLPEPIFILLGVMPFLMTKYTISNSVSLFKSNRQLFIFRQILPFDLAVASICSEFLILVIITIFLLVVCYALNIPFYLHDPIKAMTFIGLYICCLFSLTLLFAMLGVFIAIFQKLNIVFMRGMFFISGIFYPVESIPEDFRVYFLLNPLFQTVQALRESMMKVGSYTPYADLPYMLKFSVIFIFISVALYTSFRPRLIMKINEI